MESCCPNCGYCPHCGRSAQPYRTLPFYTPYPWYQTGPTWIVSTPFVQTPACAPQPTITITTASC